MNYAQSRAGRMLSRSAGGGAVRRVLAGLAATAVAVVSLVVTTAAPAAAISVGDYKIVRLQPNFESEVAVQAWGSGDGTGEGAEVVTSSLWQNSASQRWKMTYTQWTGSFWYVTFQSQYAFSGGKKCMTATRAEQVLLSTCAGKATQQFTLQKRLDDPVGDHFALYNKYFTDRYVTPERGSLPYRLYCSSRGLVVPHSLQIITL